MQHLIYLGEEIGDTHFAGQFDLHKEVLPIVQFLKDAWWMVMWVKHPEGQDFELDVQSSDDVRQVKALVHEKTGIPPNQQRLTDYFGRKFEERHPVSAYARGMLNTFATLSRVEIEDDSTPVEIVDDSMQIFVKPAGGECYSFEASGAETVQQLKLKISLRVGIPPDEQQLYCASCKRLTDEHTLSQSEITSQSMIWMIRSPWA